MLGHKTSLSKFKNTEIISDLSQPQCYKLINQLEGKKPGKRKNMWRLKNELNSQWVTEEIKEEKNNTWKQNEKTVIQNLCNAAKAVLRQVCGTTSQPLETKIT